MSYLQKTNKKHAKHKTDPSVVKMQETLQTKVNPAASNPTTAPRPTFGRRSGTR